MIGLAVWVVILLTAPLRRPDWEVMPEAFKGTVFLLALVICASLMPVEKLPAASWQTALGLGFVSAVFDNIPLTALALKQGGYDWGYPRLCGRFRRIDDLVRLVGGRRAVEHVSGSQIGRALVDARLAYRRGLRGRIFRDARGAGLASRRAALGRGRSTIQASLAREQAMTTISNSGYSL